MENELTIRPMRLEDIDRVLAVEKRSFTSPWSRLMFFDELENPRARYFVAEISGRIVGYTGFWIILDEGHITNIAVDPSYRRMKIGTRLMEKIIESARSSKLRALTLEVRKSNIAAISMYKKFGFKVEGLRKNYYSDTHEDALIMWCYLDGE
ncbi:putative ribosomal-protein-alanine acetyltransferase RimI [Thermoclostridium stercorarium subsp. stercorarium DSM 8532]|jgi:ribosomal-protein-alanine N-acetyltransferase|uniref:[Ribosomal protein bS18]-alanine N-acetyltransferase n=3 Tax=Thermoclostridium stercorarium TaxID=1510 RepID=L7VS43_THES1|nr:ribosomal protein S18-alanine N-acetyltransferase [Thermoclostridium stercorarium]AGC69597.1 putative ribosomal-protein-alanine acetyltransferase RimI [Thermoclostridium stercorarium subsp. stercorarium DSM 8532]AGI40547.1 ribosomal protein-alanine acetyltransferase [Thermoclostridium stercorarium subsp. stercorarium DSM 8532]ANW99826.1 ribosomal-protein-alanine N-acetyltransferase RimI [Thermoclostridium stercorarium subsp. thermolacticum DSM 2910]ANX02453.1 ribosomal-protein-alanine N-acet